MSGRLEEAKHYRGCGLHPIPFHRESKAPALEEGEILAFRERRPTDAELKKFFADPQRNIGLVTGPAAGHLFVVDVDGEVGRQTIREVMRGEDLPPTPTVLTDRGYHAYFYADDLLPTRHLPKLGVDLCGEAWQVVAPSSRHPNGANYHWAPGRSFTDVDRATVPKALIDFAIQPTMLSTDGSLAPHLTTTADVHAHLGASNQKSRLLALSGRLLAPSSLEIYGGWPHILENVDVNLRCAHWLGLLSVEVGKRFACVLPGHPTEPAMARLYWNTKSPQGSMTLKYCDNHYHSGEFWYSLPDVFASRNYREVVRLRGPETPVWQLRLLIAAGVILPYPVIGRLLPPDAPRYVKPVYDGFLDLLRAKWLHTPGEPTPFTWTFAAAWCGMRSVGYVVGAIKWLIKEGYLQQVASHRPTKGRKMALFLPGAP